MKGKQLTAGRQSGIELLKIIAVFLIIISHVVMTMYIENSYIPYEDYLIADISIANTNIQHLLLVIFRYFGTIGNLIFFTCTAWFLTDKSGHGVQKVFLLAADVWAISFTILICSLFFLKGEMPFVLVLKSIFPNLFANNWYITCYLLFYLLHPILNLCINSMNQRMLFRMTLALCIIYFGGSFFVQSFGFPSFIIYWIAGYFIIVYLKKYHVSYMNNIKWNVIAMICSGSGLIFLILATAFLGEHYILFSNRMLYWNTLNNPFIFLFTISAMNCARKMKFMNTGINYLSRLSLYIYLIHENLILREMCRPYMVRAFYVKWGHRKIVLQVIVLAFIIMCMSIVASIIYDRLIRPIVRKIANTVFEKSKYFYFKLENYFLSFSDKQ